MMARRVLSRSRASGDSGHPFSDAVSTGQCLPYYAVRGRAVHRLHVGVNAYSSADCRCSRTAKSPTRQGSAFGPLLGPRALCAERRAEALGRGPAPTGGGRVALFSTLPSWAMTGSFSQSPLTLPAGPISCPVTIEGSGPRGPPQHKVPENSSGRTTVRIALVPSWRIYK